MGGEGPFLLPSCPRGLRTLTNDESERLTRTHNERYTPQRCITCRGKGTFRWWSDDTHTEVVEYKCNCPDQYLMHRYFLWSGVGVRYQRLGWGDLREETAEIQAIVRDYLDDAEENVDRGAGFIFYGAKGTGKTLLSQLLVKQLLADGVDCCCTTFNALIDMFTLAWKSQEEQAWFHRRVRNTTVLLIDDIGKEGRVSNAATPDSTSLVERIIDEVLRWRVANAAPTIITTNEDPYTDTFELRYGLGVMDLLAESAISYEFVGSTYRPDADLRTADERTSGLRRPVVVG